MSLKWVRVEEQKVEHVKSFFKCFQASFTNWSCPAWEFENGNIANIWMRMDILTCYVNCVTCYKFHLFFFGHLNGISLSTIVKMPLLYNCLYCRITGNTKEMKIICFLSHLSRGVLQNRLVAQLCLDIHILVSVDAHCLDNLSNYSLNAII